MNKYEIIIYWSEEDEAFIVEVPEFAGCITDGETYQAALANAEIIVQEWIETAKELGRKIPVERAQCRRLRPVLNHIGLCIRAFVRIESHCY